METREEILKNLKDALKRLGLNIEEIEIERPKDPANGDYSTNIALIFAKKLNKSPKECAENIVKSLGKNEYLEKTEVAGPGFINFYLSKDYFQKQVLEIIRQGNKYGSIDIGKGQNASVEYVSANPTGPLHIGNARGGPIGDVIANTLEKAGYKVTREYLHNDVGGQVEKLGEAIYYLLFPRKLPKNYELQYKGVYVYELAKKVVAKLHSEKLPKDKFVKEAGKIAVSVMLAEIMDDVEKMGIKFDRVVCESDLKKEAKNVISRLKEVKEQDNALWFAPNDEFLKDRETVLQKSDGDYTYFASDIVYHEQKCRDNDLVIDVLGANHSGHVPRLKAAVKSLGFNPEKLSVVLYQFVRIKRGNEIVKMSKRAGDFVTAKEVLEEVGKDAFRFFLLMHKPQSHMDFDLELAKKKASDNPVYYVQYAHARISSIFRRIQDSGFKIQEANISLLREKEEIDLIRHLLKLSDIVEEAAENFGVNVFTNFAIDTASLFHRFYETHQVLTEDKQLSLARLALLKATQITLKNILDILGIEAPQEM